MKNIIYTLLAAVLLTGCASDENKSLEIVKKAFPNSKVYKFPDKVFTFIVVDSVGIKKVTCLNLTDHEIDVVLIGVQK